MATVYTQGWVKPSRAENDWGVGTNPWKDDILESEGPTALIEVADLIDSNNARIFTKLTVGGATTTYLKSTQYRFEVPPNATILGLKIQFRCQGATGSEAGHVIDNSVKLVIAESYSGSDEGAGSSSAKWGSGTSEASETRFNAETEGEKAGYSSQQLTPAKVNSPGFGTAISGKAHASNAGGTEPYAFIDVARLKVWYTMATSDGLHTGSVTTLKSSDLTFWESGNQTVTPTLKNSSMKVPCHVGNSLSSVIGYTATASI